MSIEVPVVDLRGARQEVVASIDAALHDVGFMAVIGHGVDQALIGRMFGAVAGFFAQPTAVKLAAAPADPGSPRGYTFVGATAQANAHEEATTTDLVETFNAGLDDIPDTVEYRAAAAHFVPNIWPAQPVELRVVWGEYLATMQALAGRVMGLMAEALGLDAAYFERLIDRPMASVTANHYPALDHEPAAGQLRGGAHTDYGTITLLATDGRPGLQLLDGDGSWAPAAAVPGSFHVNTGDMMQHWSGGRWRSTWHRVAPPAGGPPYPERTSIAYFHSPNAETVVDLLPGCDADGERPAPVSAGEYLKAKIERYHAPRSNAAAPSA